MGPLKPANLNHLPHQRKETDPVSETSCFLVSRIPDIGYHRQNPLESVDNFSYVDEVYVKFLDLGENRNFINIADSIQILLLVTLISFQSESTSFRVSTR
jgi:hypothetical protein